MGITATLSRRSAARTAATGTPLRPDIQGLRAVAVTLVLLYHLWPHKLTGGFAGVDVFFVISGFLITSHLLAHPPTRGRNLLEFWSRRIRRLLPAALLVLATTLVASWLILPDTRWANTAADIRASALYFVNWRLANQAVDYLAAANAASPVQHFWSLSVEEQFYLVWPVVIFLLVGLAAWRRWSARWIVMAGLSAIVIASLVYSIHATNAEPARAYFVTPTRMWELGIGGLLAAALSGRAFGRDTQDEFVPLPTWLRSVLAWAGFAAIGWTAYRYTGSTPFPGYEALLPVLGTAAVIAAAPPMVPGSPGPLLAFRPVRWLGDVSYSVYLWHWPLIVLLPVATGHRLYRLDKIAIIVGALVLAGLTKRFVEDPIRKPQWGRPLFKPYALGAVAMAVVVAGAAVQLAQVHHREQQAAQVLQQALDGHNPCFGAAAMAAPAGRCPVHNSGTLTPTPLAASMDKSDAYGFISGKKDCFSYLPNFPIDICHFGDQSSKIRVALIGNSHAGEWVPAMERIANQEHWNLTTYLASRCANGDVLQSIGTPAQDQACLVWGRKVTQAVIKGNYDLVVMTNRLSANAVGQNRDGSQRPYALGYEAVLRAFAKANLRVVGIRDTPAPGMSVPDCLAKHSTDFSRCNGTRAAWLPREPLTTAIQALHDPRITEANLINYICHPVVCPAEVGGVPVYFDSSHLTATYNATLAPFLAPYLIRALHGG